MQADGTGYPAGSGRAQRRPILQPDSPERRTGSGVTGRLAAVGSLAPAGDQTDRHGRRRERQRQWQHERHEVRRDGEDAEPDR